MSAVRYRALLIGSGAVSGVTLEDIYRWNGVVFCADGGVDSARELGLEPKLVFGDFDSITEESKEYLEVREIPIRRFSVEKDKSDLELALDYLIQEGFREVLVLGATGSRLDHTMSNLQLLPRYASFGMRLRILDAHNEITLLEEENHLEPDDRYCSLLPLSREGILVTCTGFRYNLLCERIPFGSTLGISNYVVEEKPQIRLHDGIGLLFRSRD